VLIPEAAVQRKPQGTFTYVVKTTQSPDGHDVSKVEERDIVLGPSEGDERSVDSGLSPDEVVVIEGVDKLQPGSTVTTRVPGGAPAGAKGSRPGGAHGKQSGAPAGKNPAGKKRTGE
jgi:hypothetical protein